MGAQSLQYITDEQGNKTAVIMSIEDYERLLTTYNFKEKVREDICAGLVDVLYTPNEEKDEQDIEAFLNELEDISVQAVSERSQKAN